MNNYWNIWWVFVVLPPIATNTMLLMLFYRKFLSDLDSPLYKYGLLLGTMFTSKCFLIGMILRALT